MPEETNQQLNKFLDNFDKERITQDDFLKAFQLVVSHLNNQDAKIEKVIELIRKIATDSTDAIKKETSNTLDVLKKQTNELFVGERLADMDKSQKSAFDGLKSEISGLFEGFKGELNNLSASKLERTKAEFGTLLDARIRSLKKNKEITFADFKDELETFLEEKLKEILKDIKYLKNRPIYVAGGAVSASHSPIHESFTMNGSDTTVTLAQAVGAQGTALMVRYQGQMLDLTTHYTVNGTKITLVGFTPASTTIISVTYWP